MELKVIRPAGKTVATPAAANRLTGVAERFSLNSAGGEADKTASGSLKNAKAIRLGKGRGSNGPQIKGVKKILAKELIPFTRQLASMSSAGMPILPVLETLRDQCADPNFKIVLEKVTSAVESGAPLSEGLAQFPQIFDDTYVNLAIAGEQSGKFAEIMKRLAVMIDSASRLRRKVKSAMTYPTVIVSIAMLMAAGLIQFVVPIFAEMFSGFGKDLPWLTQQMVNISDFVKGWWYIIIPAIAAAVWLFLRWKKTPDGSYKFDRFILVIPIFGMLNQKSLIARFSRIFAEMINAGVPVLNAMKIVSAAIGNQVLEKSVMDARQEVEQGNQLSVSLTGKPYMPMLLTRMVGAGEKAGRVEDMLTSVADAYDEDVEATLTTLTALMEPFLMVFLGVIIGTVVTAMFLPIFNMGSLAQ